MKSRDAALVTAGYVFLFFLACVPGFSVRAEIKPLPLDWYSKGRGVQNLEVLEKVLAKDSWTTEESETLEELVKSSTVREMQNNERNRQVWLERAREKNSGHDAQSAELMLQLNKDLKEQRALVFASLLQRLPLSNLNEQRLRLLEDFGEDFEIVTLLPHVLEAMKKDPYDSILFNSFLYQAFQRECFRGRERKIR